MTSPTRRSLLAGAAGALALAATGSAGFAQSAPVPFTSVRVDVGPLLAQGLGPTADLIARATQDEARRVFAGRLGGPGPTLVVRYTSLSLRAYAGGGGGRFSGGGGVSSDYLEGEALIVDRGRVLARFPQLVTLPSSYGGAWYDPANEPRRIVGLAQTYVQWLGRKLS